MDFITDAVGLPYKVEWWGSYHRVLSYGLFIGWQEENNGGKLNQEIYQQMSEVASPEREKLELWLVGQQAAGYMCFHLTLVARPVRITVEFEDFAKSVCSDFYYRDNGWFLPKFFDDDGDDGTSVASRQEYYRRCTDAGLSPYDPKPKHRAGVMESFYPIAGSDNNIGKLVHDGALVMAELSPMLKSCLLRDELTLFLLADNSD